LLESNAPLEDEILSYFGDRFGVSSDALRDLRFFENGDEIWTTYSFPPAGIAWERPPGLRALRRMPDGLKPTSAFLALLGPHITASRIDVSGSALRELLLGQRIAAAVADGYVALVFRGDVLGCGRVRANRLHAVIPTGRRQELLESL
jgi:hypothetical protein